MDCVDEHGQYRESFESNLALLAKRSGLPAYCLHVRGLCRERSALRR